MKDYTEMLMDSIEGSRGRMSVHCEMADALRRKGLGREEAEKEMAERMEQGYRRKLAPGNAFGMDPFFRAVLEEAVAGTDFREAARQVMELSGVWR